MLYRKSIFQGYLVSAITFLQFYYDQIVTACGTAIIDFLMLRIRFSVAIVKSIFDCPLALMYVGGLFGLFNIIRLFYDINSSSNILFSSIVSAYHNDNFALESIMIRTFSAGNPLIRLCSLSRKPFKGTEN